MVASKESTGSQFKFKLFKYKGILFGGEHHNWYNLDHYTLVNTALGLIYIQLVPIDPFHLNLTHWTLSFHCEPRWRRT